MVKVYMGNDIDLLDESESSGKTAGEVQKVFSDDYAKVTFAFCVSYTLPCSEPK